LNEDCLKLTTYFGERDRANGAFLADALLDVYERHEIRTSILLRGIEGFGVKHRLQTQRLLSLSEDLPLITVAVDARPRVMAALEEVEQLSGHGLISLERARMPADPTRAIRLADDLGDATKLTIYCGRQQRVAGKPAHVAVVELLHRHGIAGATVLLGVDGTAHGERRRARFFAGNADVPLMIISVGEGERVGAALPELSALLPRSLVTLERVQVCKRDGDLIARPGQAPEADASGLAMWQKLMVYASEQARGDGGILYVELVRRLREAGAAGATALRGIWGYHGAHEPHGDRFWSLRRHVPVLTVVVDTPSHVRDWFEIVHELTEDTGLVTLETVPALRASGPGIEHGGLRLAPRRD
jgi:PII-like signaling protein